MKPTHGIAALAVLALVAFGCQPITDSRPVLEQRPGVLTLSGEPSITVPAEGTAGAPVIVTVITWGGGCARQGPTAASVSGLIADVTPFDSVVVSLPSNMACPADIRSYTHTATILFSAAGPAVVRVHGWSEPAKAAITVERAIQIR
ncbi:MAG TPA: hypothetical protein VG432_15015 [Gemmatimonadaceae bacterium]|nr:hypothetical protein [Gemmatimonadaceae bacterium]